MNSGGGGDRAGEGNQVAENFTKCGKVTVEVMTLTVEVAFLVGNNDKAGEVGRNASDKE